MNTMETMPHDLPWVEQQAVLLLDGATVADLQPTLTALNSAAPRMALYAGTRFNAIGDISPMLVTVEQHNDPVLQFYLEHAAQEWGSLLFTPEPLHVLAAHLRKLLTVQVLDGPEVMLRLADPAVAHALFDARTCDERLFGPIEMLITPDCVTGDWHRHQRTAPAPAGLPKRYALNPEQNAALDAVDLRRATLKLDAHLVEHFPERYSAGGLSKRWLVLDGHVRRAYAQGFTSQSDLTYYINVFAWLHRSPLEQHPQIARLLDTPSAQTPSARIATAAELARDWALAHSADKDRP